MVICLCRIEALIMTRLTDGSHPSTESGIFGPLSPHCEQVLLLGYQRSTTITVFPPCPDYGGYNVVVNDRLRVIPGTVAVSCTIGPPDTTRVGAFEQSENLLLLEVFAIDLWDSARYTGQNGNGEMVLIVV